MQAVAITFLGLCLAGSVYFLIRSLREAAEKKQLLYREIVSDMRNVVLRETNTFYPSLEGVYGGYRIKIVPVIDTLTLRSLPRLYVRIYLLIDNPVQCRIIMNDSREYLYHRGGGFGEEFISLSEINKELRLYPEGLKAGCRFDYSGVASIFSETDHFSEVSVRKNFIRATILVAKSKRSYYSVLRAAEFPGLVLKHEYFTRAIKSLLRLREEVGKLEKAG